MNFVFGFQFCNQIVCKTCERVSWWFEPSVCISLEMSFKKKDWKTHKFYSSLVEKSVADSDEVVEEVKVK